VAETFPTGFCHELVMRDMFLKKRTICESTDVEASAVSDLKRSVEKTHTHTSP